VNRGSEGRAVNEANEGLPAVQWDRGATLVHQGHKVSPVWPVLKALKAQTGRRAKPGRKDRSAPRASRGL
jgi:hypothetical protein